MIPLVADNRAKIADLCRKFGIRQLDVFGSAATGAFNQETSDIDFLVDVGEYEPGVAKRFFRFAEALEELLGRDVDLVTEAQVTNPYFRKSVDAARETVYVAGDRQAIA